MKRRLFFTLCVVIVTGLLLQSAALSQPPVEWPKRSETWVPVRPITRGPAYHWFGYYDKLQIDPSGRYVLGMEVTFEDRSPAPDDVIKVGMIDLADNDRWIELGETRAWNWQQGCMLQWRPGSKTEVVWNDRDGDTFVCHILDIKTRKMRTIPFPVYSVSPDGTWGVTPDFRRINDMRPGYGYAGPADPNADEFAPDDSGIWKVNLDTGEATLIITIADMLKIPYPGGEIADKKHYFNHLLFSPDGSRFIFLNRWRINEFRASNPTTPFDTRMLTANLDGGDIRVVDDSGYTSHFIWRDPEHILAWTKQQSHGDRFYLFKDDGSTVGTAVGPDVMTRNGHCTYLPGNEDDMCDWFLEALRSDIYDTQGGTTLEAIHCGVMAGSLQIVVDNFAGLEARPGKILLIPSMPCGWDRTAFCLLYRGNRYDVEVTNDRVQAAMAGSGETKVRVNGSAETLKPGDLVTLSYSKKHRTERG